VALYTDDNPILGICKTYNSDSLITATDKKTTIWGLPLSIKDEKILDGKVTNILFSNFKLIVSTQEALTFSLKSKLHLMCDNGSFSIETEARNIFHILEIVKAVTIGDQKENISIIFIAAEGFIEVYGLRNKEIQKITNLKCDDHTDVLSLAYNEERSMLFAGHKSGCLSIWQIDDINFKPITIIKIHEDAINKILIHKSNYLLTCSSDTKVRICDLTNNGAISEITLGITIPILDMFLSKNFENEDIFIFYLKSSELVGYKEGGESGFEQIFSVPGTQGSTRRFVVDYENPKRDKNSGEYLLFTDGAFLDINMWEPAQKQGGNFQQGGYKQPNQNKYGYDGNKGKRYFQK